MSSSLRSDDELLSGVSVGTFRWKKDKSFITLPEPTTSTTFELRGWGPYLTARAGASFIKTVQQDLATIDALSFPLSLLFTMTRLSLTPSTFQNQGITELHIVIAGATAHAEQRLLFDTNYWMEIGYVYKNIPKIYLHFVGPEAATAATLKKSFTTKKINKNSNGKKSKKKNKKNKPMAPRVTKNTCVEHFRGTSIDFFKQNPLLLNQNEKATRATIVIGFNPGFGSGNAPIVASWTKDLLTLSDTNVPIIFTQANDYSDLVGELLVLQQIVGSKFVMTPTRNAFPMATTAHEPGRRESWSCGNSFTYTIQGWNGKESKRRGAIYIKEPRTLARSLAQVVTLQQQMDKKGGTPPGMQGGGKMPPIRMRVDETGQLDMGWKGTKDGATEGTKSTITASSATTKSTTAESSTTTKSSTTTSTPTTAPVKLVKKKVSKLEVEVLEEEKVKEEMKKKKKIPEQKKVETKSTRRSKEEIAAHRSFMEDLGKHAKSIGFMPDMSMIDEGKKLAAEGRVQQQQQQTTRSSQQQQPEENAKKNQKVEIPKLALELDY